MYNLFTDVRTEKKLREYMNLRTDIKDKLDKLKQNPRKANGDHQLHGKLKGKWACWLGSNIRLIYIIDENSKTIFTDGVGNHKIY